MRGVLDVELFLQAPARFKQPFGAILGDRAPLALALGFQCATPFAYPRPAALGAGDEVARIKLHRHRPILIGRRLLGLVAFAREALLGLAQRLAASLAGAQLLRQLVAAFGPVELVLTAVDLRRLGEDLPRDLTEVAIRVRRRVGRHLRPVDRHHPDRHKSRPGAEPEHAREHLAQGPLVSAAELRDRRVIGS
jgi:hypothetical protein